MNGTVWVVITLNGRHQVADLEVLDRPPAWDLAALNQVCYTGGVNGGDAVPWHGGL